jgi:hypothetical protein
MKHSFKLYNRTTLWLKLRFFRAEIPQDVASERLFRFGYTCNSLLQPLVRISVNPSASVLKN